MIMTRTSNKLSREWLFHLGDVPNAQEPGLDDDRWDEVDIPHDWSMAGKFVRSRQENFWLASLRAIDSRMGYLPQGIGWYRKHLHVPKEWDGKRVSIQFDGVYREAKVWFNGHLLGFRPYGYATFHYDLTPYLRLGESNVLAVRVDNTGCSTRWYTGSGIYRKVTLTVMNPVHVAQWGTWWTTPEVSKERAIVHVRTTIANDSREPSIAITLTSSIYDGGKEVTTTTTAITITRAMQEVEQDLVLPSPRLWSPTSPHVYEIKTRIVREEAILDEYITPLGIRWFKFDPNEGFFLNGENIKFYGVCMHHDNGAIGAREYTRAAERKLEILKGMGCNAIRTSHNPPSQEFLDACDRMGFMVMDEAFDEWTLPKSPEGYTKWFYKPVVEGESTCWYERDVTDFVHRDRNHPSVILWSCGNEVSEQNSTHGDLGVRVLKDLLVVFHREDPTRPVTQGCNQVEQANKTGFAQLLDVVGYNYFGDKVLKQLPNGFWCMYDEEHKAYPNRIMIGSENCSAFNTRGVFEYPIAMMGNRHGKIRPNFQMTDYDVTSEFPLRILKTRPYVCGYFSWTGFDYIGEPSPYDWPAISSYFGIVDLCGFPKDTYFLHKSMWTDPVRDSPIVHLVPSAWNFHEGQEIEVWAYTNCESVELVLNGRSLGEKRMDEFDDILHQFWFVQYEPGKLEAIARIGGRSVATASYMTAGAPHHLIVKADRKEVLADTDDILFIEVSMLDNRGILAPLAENLVTFTVKGPGRILGVANGNPISHEPLDDSQIHLFMGRALVVLQPTGNPGTVSVSIHAPMVVSATFQVIVR